jgi:hypothetical protein
MGRSCQFFQMQGTLIHGFLLNGQIHVDRYRYELYRSIKSADVWEWGPFLGGHVDPGQKKHGLADHVYEGQLTQDPNTMLHSCESKGLCPVRDGANVVQIIPITSDKAPKKEYMTESIVANFEEPSKKRKASEDISGRPDKMASNAALKEPGHTLLEPRENWWVRHGTTERPPIYSADGDILPYYLVSSSCSLFNTYRLSHYHVTRPSTNCAVSSVYSNLAICFPASRIPKSSRISISRRALEICAISQTALT